MGFSLLSHFQIWPARVVCFVLNAVDDVFIKCLVWYWVLCHCVQFSSHNNSRDRNYCLHVSEKKKLGWREMKRIAIAKIYKASNGEGGFKLWSSLLPSPRSVLYLLLLGSGGGEACTQGAEAVP